VDAAVTEVDPLTFDLAEAQATFATSEQLAAIERTVIASIVLDSSVLRFAADEVRGSDFADPRLGRVFEGLFEMFAAGEPISVITVGEHFARWNVGADGSVLHRWVSEVGVAAQVGWYARKVHEYAMRRGIQRQAVRLAQSAQTSGAPGEAIAQSIESLRELLAITSTAEVSARPLGRILDIPDEYDWVVEGLLERGDRLLLTGSEGGGKTTLLRQVAICAAAGIHPFFGYPISPAKVLYVDTENTEKQWAREARGMVSTANNAPAASADPSEVLALACIKRIDVTRDSDLGMLHKLVDDHKPDMLFIGPLYRLIPRAINSDDEATPLLTALDTIRDRGVSLIIEAHAGHGTQGAAERDMRPRGSSALMGWPEFGLGLRPDRNAKSSNEFQLMRWRGHRDASRKWPTRLARGTGEWPWTPTLAGAR
jgi:hypothetical protein